MSDLAAKLLRRIPKQPQTIIVTCCYALAAAIAAVAFQLAITLLYRFGILRLSHFSTATFLIGSFTMVVASSALVGWLLNSFCRDAAGSGIPQLKVAFW